MKHHKIIGLLLCTTVFLTGCATRQNIAPPADFTSQPKKILITHLSGMENATYIPPTTQTNQGLLVALIDAAVVHNAADIGPAVNRLVSAPILDEHYYKRFDTFYRGHDFTIVRADKPVAKNQLYSPKIKEGKYAPYDFTELKGQYDADYALILDVLKFSATRFGYMHRPHGRSNVSLYLVDLSDNSIVAEYKTNEVINDAEGDWDTPPAFYALTQSVRNSLTMALDEAYSIISGDKPLK
tara:strand:+ start:474 stop:1193 length:720 start_codon:yes stop_codon:yes gene_type:complete